MPAERHVKRGLMEEEGKKWTKDLPKEQWLHAILENMERRKPNWKTTTRKIETGGERF